MVHPVRFLYYHTFYCTFVIIQPEQYLSRSISIHHPSFFLFLNRFLNGSGKKSNIICN